MFVIQFNCVLFDLRRSRKIDFPFWAAFECNSKRNSTKAEFRIALIILILRMQKRQKRFFLTFALLATFASSSTDFALLCRFWRLRRTKQQKLPLFVNAKAVVFALLLRQNKKRQTSKYSLFAFCFWRQTQKHCKKALAERGAFLRSFNCDLHKQRSNQLTSTQI